MYKSKLLVFILLLSVILSLFAGCHAQNADAPTEPTEPSAPSQLIDPTEPSSEPTEPSAPETIELTVENIKTHIKEGMTYAQMRSLFGGQDTFANGSEGWIDCPNRVWYLNNPYDPEDIVFTHYKGIYLRIEFRFPDYDNFNQWFEECVDKSTIPTETLPDGNVYYDTSDTDHLAYWFSNMEAVCATLYTDHKVYEVLFCGDGQHSVQTDPPSLEPPNANSAAERAALKAALEYSNLTEDDIRDCEIKLNPYDSYPNYAVRFIADDYRYEYRIYDNNFRWILSVDREYIGKPKDPVDTPLTRQTAIDLALNDPLVLDSAMLQAAYERSAGADGISCPYYEVLLTTDRKSTSYKPEFCYRLRISTEDNTIFELRILDSTYMGSMGDHPEDGRLGLYTARTTANRYIREDGITPNDAKRFYHCTEGIDTPERSNYYEIYFEYKGEGWYYYIDMYSGELLSTEKVPLS
ncbi:MAG: glutathione S-transferase domain-containing protein [Ruminococcaceae bacterium]|nr:glutathione S-transferase domain-containing protein [Oscillospiraceae bacterium]